jgi:hypothetical protein
MANDKLNRNSGLDKNIDKDVGEKKFASSDMGSDVADQSGTVGGVTESQRGEDLGNIEDEDDDEM